jgi:hypothetical protein
MTVKYIVNDPKIRRNNEEFPKLEYALLALQATPSLVRVDCPTKKDYPK